MLVLLFILHPLHDSVFVNFEVIIALFFFILMVLLFQLEELIRCKHLDEANRVFLKGAEGGLRATDELYDLIIEEDCKIGDHSNALTIAYEMEAAGRMATTYHFNCLLSVQVSLL